MSTSIVLLFYMPFLHTINPFPLIITDTATIVIIYLHKKRTPMCSEYISITAALNAPINHGSTNEYNLSREFLYPLAITPSMLW